MSIIECKEVSKVYGSFPAVDKLTFTIEENSITGLIGRNGAVNFTDQLKGPSINYEQNKLEIEYSKEEFRTTMFTKDSITKQITNKNNDDYLNYALHGGSRLFVKVPRGMNISGDERYIYIDEKN